MYQEHVYLRMIVVGVVRRIDVDEGARVECVLLGDHVAWFVKDVNLRVS